MTRPWPPRRACAHPSAVRLLYCLVVLSLNLPLPQEAEAVDNGSSAAAFLGLGLGSRAQGLANGVVALADDASATYFNPAGVALSPRQMEFSHSLWLQDLALSQAALTGVRAGRLRAGLSLTRLGVTGLERRAAETARPDGTFGAEDLSLGVSAALAATPALSAGLTAKLIQQRIDTTVGRGFALDLGALYRRRGSPLQLGFALRNLGPALKLGSESYPLPLSAHLGLAWRGPLTLAVEASRTRAGDNALRAGTEYWLTDSFALRGGYLHQGSAPAGPAGTPATGPLPFPGVSAGFGVRFAGRLGLDYAVVPFRDLGTAHRFSLSVRF